MIVRRSSLVIFSFLSFITTPSFAANILFITVGHAGHVIPLFELAKSLQHHNLTFLTQQVAENYVDFSPYRNSSKFHIIFSTDDHQSLEREKQQEQDLVAHAANHSFFEGMTYVMKLLRESSEILSTKIIYVLMSNQYDLIIGNSVMKHINSLAKVAHVPCVIQSTEILPNLLDFNTPNIAAGLTRKDLTQLKYRLFNTIFNIRLAVTLAMQVFPALRERSNSYPRIPGPYNDSLALKHIFNPPQKCLELLSLSPTLHTISNLSPYQKYLGAFIDRSSIESISNDDLAQWIRSKDDQTIIYGAFGTSSLIPAERMENLINGLLDFLVEQIDASLLLVFHGKNFQTYENILSKIDKTNILNDRIRVRIEKNFLRQKWILDQKTIRIFISHCGMGSTSEGIYFHKPILCMPFNMDQFINSMAIVESNAGQSLFEPPSLFESFLRPHDFQNYQFSSKILREKLENLWTNSIFQRSIDLMSLEMKHAGGVEAGVKEIEHYLALNGDYDRYLPFQMTLPFYQRFLFDLIFIFIIVPIFIIRFCSRRSFRSNQTKIKTD